MQPLSVIDDPSKFHPTAGQTYFCLIRAATIDGYKLDIFPGEQVFSMILPLTLIYTDIAFFMIEMGEMSIAHKNMLQNMPGAGTLAIYAAQKHFAILLN